MVGEGDASCLVSDDKPSYAATKLSAGMSS